MSSTINPDQSPELESLLKMSDSLQAETQADLKTKFSENDERIAKIADLLMAKSSQPAIHGKENKNLQVLSTSIPVEKQIDDLFVTKMEEKAFYEKFVNTVRTQAPKAIEEAKITEVSKTQIENLVKIANYISEKKLGKEYPSITLPSKHIEGEVHRAQTLATGTLHLQGEHKVQTSPQEEEFRNLLHELSEHLMLSKGGPEFQKAVSRFYFAQDIPLSERVEALLDHLDRLVDSLQDTFPQTKEVCECAKKVLNTYQKEALEKKYGSAVKAAEELFQRGEIDKSISENYIRSLLKRDKQKEGIALLKALPGVPKEYENLPPNLASDRYKKLIQDNREKLVAEHQRKTIGKSIKEFVGSLLTVQTKESVLQACKNLPNFSQDTFSEEFAKATEKLVDAFLKDAPQSYISKETGELDIDKIANQIFLCFQETSKSLSTESKRQFFNVLDHVFIPQLSAKFDTILENISPVEDVLKQSACKAFQEVLTELEKIETLPVQLQPTLQFLLGGFNEYLKSSEQLLTIDLESSDKKTDYINSFLKANGFHNFGEQVGKGATATVFELTSSNNEKFALKIMGKPIPKAEWERMHLTGERIGLQFEEDKNLLSMRREVLYDPQGNVMAIIMPFVQGSSLYTCMFEKDSTTGLFAQLAFTAAQAQPLLLAIAKGIRDMGAKGIIHQDLHPGNILVPTKNGERHVSIDWTAVDNIKIIDWGYAQKVAKGGYLQRELFPLGSQYNAPEVKSVGLGVSEARISTKADAYSFGKIMAELLTGSPNINENTLKEYPELREIIQRLTEQDPDKRMSVADCFQYKYFGGTKTVS